MESYGQFCPLSKAAEVLAERWTPLVMREILLGSRHFNEIRRGVPLMSSSLLSDRLRTLERSGLIHRVKSPGSRGFEYCAAPAGEELRPIMEALSAWGHRWLRTDYREDDLDPQLLMWDIRRYVRPRAFHVERRVVVAFQLLTAAPAKDWYWLVSGRDEADLCMVDPGYPVDVYVIADLKALTQLWLGDLTLKQALASGKLQLNGPRALVTAFEQWLGQHPVAAVPRGERHAAPEPA